MARARTIKPGFFMNEYLSALPFEARLLFIGLWCIADREGRLEDRPLKIKASLMPYDNVDVDNLLELLYFSQEHFILRYVVDNTQYIQINKFAVHQNPHIKESESIIPTLESGVLAPYKHSVSTVQEQDKHQNTVIGNRETVIGIKEIGNREIVIGVAKKETIKKTRPPNKAKDGEGVLLTSNEPYKEITNYLNLRAGTNYKHASQKTKDLINARLNEREGEDKYTIQNFYDVIDKKCVEWIGTDMEMYLRPETLFSNKFEGYLNQKVSKRKEEETGNVFAKILRGENDDKRTDNRNTWVN